MDRRAFVHGTLGLTAAGWLPGCERQAQDAHSDVVGADPGTSPLPAPAPTPVTEPSVPSEPAPTPAPGTPPELDGDFPDWTLGDASSSPNTVLMFRGDPRHGFYGTGPLPDTPTLLWRKRLGAHTGTRADGTSYRWAGTGWTGQPVRWGRRVYFGALDTNFYCLDAESGEQRWRFEDAGMFKGSCCFYRGRLYVGNVDNRVRCLDGRDGSLVWSYNTGRDCDSSPCVVGDRLYIGGEDGKLKCLDPATGALVWELALGEGVGAPRGSGGIESSPAVADGEVYVGHYDGYLICVDAERGEERWRAPTGGDTDVSPVVVGDRIYIATETGSPLLRVFDRSNEGALVWEFEQWRGFWSTPAVAEGRVYIGGHDGRMYCLAADSGAVQWTFAAAASIWCSPAVVEGKVAFGAHDPYFYVLDAKSGTLVWKYEVGGRTHSTPCIVDGKIHVGSTNGYFHCFG